MATQFSRPSTPLSQAATPSTPVGGAWRHPQIEEISRRQNASSFTDRNVKNIGYNTAGLIAVWVLGRLLSSTFPSLFQSGSALDPYALYIYHGVQIIFVYNVIIAFSPLFRTKDDLSDIPLTPAQRKLLGLPPTSKPPTPGSQYSTPPRFPRSSTPLSGSPAGKPGSYNNSPLSGTPRRESSSFASGAIPFIQKVNGGLNGSRRASYGSSSPLGAANSRGVSNVPETPATPTPAVGKGATVGLSNKWLYDTGRRNSGSRLYT
ncbi:nuclear pore complex component-domain-containing protein [Bisporella sp. PMI_857]|nr:nuclear pore complex component-domain-containing protein [Bisporella sp. PMI_857]